MRPKHLDEFIGQEHIIGVEGVLKKAIANDALFSMILWGPPGCGKTTLAKTIASETKSYFCHFSAVLAGVKEIKEVIQEANKQWNFYEKRTILFVDEIHRFNKAQQDAFLHHVESGLITLIGATTENPSFEVISALLSRCRVIRLYPLSNNDLEKIIDRALKDKENGLGNIDIELSIDVLNHLVSIADGDARTVLNGLELAVSFVMQKQNPQNSDSKIFVSLDDIEQSLQQKALLYDKAGEEHYNIISAFHKSLRGSDPDAALYWLVRMIEGGEDPLYIARRMVRFASEDIGNADPFALSVAINSMESFNFLGIPEGELALCQAAVYLATAPKSNSIYTAYKKVKELIKGTGSLPVPMHIRNAPTKLMEEMGYGKGYQYSHDHKDAYSVQEYLPEKISGQYFYHPTNRGYEQTIKQRLDKWREIKEKAKKQAKQT
ncbi:MAG: replication-associated recombination protein A [Desulfobacterales bacterium]|nr:replication-associated recombination protein A [Desulfobacterales bacterium]